MLRDCLLGTQAKTLAGYRPNVLILSLNSGLASNRIRDGEAPPIPIGSLDVQFDVNVGMMCGRYLLINYSLFKQGVRLVARATVGHEVEKALTNNTVT